jgi:hypothetical protein
VHLLDLLESLGSLFLADYRFPLTILEVAHYLVMSLPLLLIFLTLLTKLEFHELHLLFVYSLVFLPALSGHLECLLSSLGLLLELPHAFRAAHSLLLLVGPHRVNIFRILLFEVF